MTETIFMVPRSALCVFPQVFHEYALDTLPDIAKPIIVDIGANVGAFAWAALQRYTDGLVIAAVEPHPATFAMLKANMRDMAVKVMQAAVVFPKKAETAKLFEGSHANTECSLRDDVRWPDADGGSHVSQDLENSVEVPLFDASELPACDILKVDTEGSEVEILTGYKYLPEVEVLLVEAHAVGGDLQGQMRHIAALAGKAGLTAVDIRGTTIRFVRDLTGMKVAPGASVPSAQPGEEAPEGDWAIVETGATARRFGCVVPSPVNAGPCFELDPCYEISPMRVLVPIPVPGGGVVPNYIQFHRPFVWGDGAKTMVWASTIKRISRAEAGAYLFLLKNPQKSHVG